MLSVHHVSLPPPRNPGYTTVVPHCVLFVYILNEETTHGHPQFPDDIKYHCFVIVLLDMPSASQFSIIQFLDPMCDSIVVTHWLWPKTTECENSKTDNHNGIKWQSRITLRSHMLLYNSTTIDTYVRPESHYEVLEHHHSTLALHKALEEGKWKVQVTGFIDDKLCFPVLIISHKCCVGCINYRRKYWMLLDRLQETSLHMGF